MLRSIYIVLLICYNLIKVLSFQEVARIFEKTTNLKHRAIFYLVYSAGLRVGEVVSLKVSDIDSSRMLIHVKQGKGKKDRYTVLSEIALEELRNYARKYRPDDWLFEGGTNLRYIQEMLGHSSSKTTEIYTHVTEKSITKVKSPLDRLMTRK